VTVRETTVVHSNVSAHELIATGQVDVPSGSVRERKEFLHEVTVAICIAALSAWWADSPIID